jgi:Dehydrogenases with different specificities (related to short-chain alcohol dehydrogenases)
VDEIRSFGVKSFALKVDISKPEEVDRMIKEIMNAFGTIDVAFNNAGICINKNVEDMSLEEWRKVIDVNLTGTYLTTKATGMIMIKNKKGSIINTASMAAHIIPDAQFHCAYSASKAGIIQLSKALAMEWAPYNVRVNCLSPGYTATELTKQVIKPCWSEKTPMKRVGTTEDMQGAVLYLASDASLYTTGIDILVDGGYCCN